MSPAAAWVALLHCAGPPATAPVPLSLPLGASCAALAWRGFEAPADRADERRFDKAEVHGLLLGGASGHFTQWQRRELRSFDGLVTTIKLGRLYVKPGDEWLPLAHVNLLGDGEPDTRAMISLRVMVDPKTEKPYVLTRQGRDGEFMRFDIDLKPKQPIALEVLPVEQHKLLVSVNGTEFWMSHDVRITGLQVTGSGMDVAFEPFYLLHR